MFPAALWPVIADEYPFLEQGLWIAGALGAAAVIIAFLSRWRKRTRTDDRITASDQLAQYRALYERGESSQEEYDKLRPVLGGELRRLAGRRGSGEPGPAAPPRAVTPAPPPEPPRPTEPGPPPAGPSTPAPPDPGIRPA